MLANGLVRSLTNVLLTSFYNNASRSFSTAVPKMKRFKIERFNRDAEETPKMVSYDVDLSDCGPMVLDALHEIKHKQDSSLSFRRSCREGICGSCAMFINGKPRLACITPISEKGSEEIRPLPHQTIIKDLVTDLTKLYEAHAAVQPYLQPKETSLPVDGKEIIQSKEDRQKLNGQYECILCFCCSTSCPSYWWRSDIYLGPSALLHASRWVKDSRDGEAFERLKYLNEEPDRVNRCHFIQNCTNTCPKNLNPAKEIQGLLHRINTNNSDN
eukprot:TRINITY_DN26582_c0_g1_i1.p1 TRINITY_DN26582_c0_g1~~TRINITY_DN26582_c0_g1_i1.p1  ORF type:complete len:271 (+),score=23.14 TRINITY_DN26582_c0_g1_i1:92-904(+)